MNPNSKVSLSFIITDHTLLFGNLYNIWETFIFVYLFLDHIII